MLPRTVAIPEKHLRILGWMATGTAVTMYLSYVDQIARNLDGQKGSLLQPAATTLNCLLWCAYGLLRQKTDWPMVIANVPGIALGLIAVVTSW